MEETFNLTHSPGNKIKLEAPVSEFHPDPLAAGCKLVNEVIL